MRVPTETAVRATSGTRVIGSPSLLYSIYQRFLTRAARHPRGSEPLRALQHGKFEQ